MITPITQQEINQNKVASLPARPNASTAFGGAGYTSLQLRQAFDRLPLLLAARYNALVEAISASDEKGLAALIPTGLQDPEGNPYSLKELLSHIADGTLATYLKVDGQYLDLALKALAPLDSPSFSGSPTVATPPLSDTSERIATTAWVKQLYQGENTEQSTAKPEAELPKFWEKYLSEKISIIQSLQQEGGKDCFSFIVITDILYGENLGKKSPLLAKKIADECGIKYVLILGDCGTRNGILKDREYIDEEWDDIEKMIAPIRDRLLITDGNHDGSYGATDGDGDGVIDDVHGTGNSAFNWTPQKKYNQIKRKVSLIDGVTFDESGCGYYADDKVAKVRYIVLSTHNNAYEENEDGSSKYSNMINFRYGQSQFDLVIDALNTLEDGWSVIVASHVPLDRSGELLHWGATEVNDDNYLVSGQVECWLMADVLNAFVNRKPYTGSFTGTQAEVKYKNLADKNSDDWLEGYSTTSGTESKLTQEEGSDVANFIGDGETNIIGRTIYYKNAVVTGKRLVFYNANKEVVYSCYPGNFTFSGFDGIATEGYVTIGDIAEELYTAVYVRLCLASGAEEPIITIDEPIEESGNAFDAVSVDVDFTNANGTLIGYFGGHLHKDGQWGTTYNWGGRLKQCDFWTISTSCDSPNENDGSNIDRSVGAFTEHSFDVFTVNKATRTIHATKIGAGALRQVIHY